LQSSAVNTATVAGFTIFFVFDQSHPISAMNAEIGGQRPHKAAFETAKSAFSADSCAFRTAWNKAGKPDPQVFRR
jgi:hypothetical protein